MKKQAVASVKKANSGVSFVARVKKLRSGASLLDLLFDLSKFPCSNPKTHRRRMRAINAQFAKIGVGATIS